MKININKTTRIRVYNDENYVIEDYVKKDNTKNFKVKGSLFKWTVRGFYGDMVSLALDYIQTPSAYRKQAINSFEELIKEINNAEKRIIKKINEFCGNKKEN